MSNRKERKKPAIDSASQQDLAQRLGQRLVEARTKQDMDIVTIANRLRLQKTYLEGLESGDWHDLPDKVYAMGFLRQYAEVLKIDVSEEVELLKLGTPTLKSSQTIADPSIVPRKIWFRMMLILFVVAFVIFNVFYFAKQELDPIDLGQYSPESVDKNDSSLSQKAQQDHQLTAEVKQSGITFEANQALNPENTKEAIEQAIVLDAQFAKVAEKNVQDVEESSTEMDNTQEVSSTQVNETMVQAKMHQYQFSALGQDVWVKIADSDKKILLSTLIPSGSSKTIQHSSEVLYLTCGNTIALSVHKDGQLILSAGELGKSGQVVRHYKIGEPDSGLADE